MVKTTLITWSASSTCATVRATCFKVTTKRLVKVIWLKTANYERKTLNFKLENLAIHVWSFFMETLFYQL